MNALARCRLCGGEPVEVERIHAHVVSCRTCGLQVRQSEMGQGDAAERWNRLHATPMIGTRYRDESGEVVAMVAPAEATADIIDELTISKIHPATAKWRSALATLPESE